MQQNEPQQTHTHKQNTKQQKKCDHCHQPVDKLYDLTPIEMGDSGTTYLVCEECYEDAARELEQDGYHVDVG